MAITYPKKGETITIDKGKVKIKTGTLNTDGSCAETAAPIYTAKKDPHTIAIPIPTKDKEIAGITFTEFCKNADGNKGWGVLHTDPKLTITKGGTLTIEGTLTNTEKCIEITLTTAVNITNTDTKKAAATGGETVAYGHIFTEGFDTILSN
uniref:Uncharacterized protein n=1 Tax=Theileria annulata TaxID=5874 RepID=A0A3B0NC96_THEAN